MAKQLGRGTAGGQVLELARAFSDDLLGDEEDTFARMEVAFAAPLPALMRRVTAAVSTQRGLSRLTGDAATMDALNRARSGVIDACTPLVVKLAGVAFDKALKSIGRELTVCEKTLPRRYDGIAKLAVDAARDTRPKVLANVIDGYRGVVTSTRSGFKAEVRVQVKAAADVEELLKRLFSPDPVGARGFGGRGIWWRGCSELQAAAREVSTRSANLTRGAAMHAFNEVGKARL